MTLSQLKEFFDVCIDKYMRARIEPGKNVLFTRLISADIKLWYGKYFPFSITFGKFTFFNFFCLWTLRGLENILPKKSSRG